MATLVGVAVLAVVVGGASPEAAGGLPSRVTPVVLAARKAGPAVVNIQIERVVVRRFPDVGIPGLNDLFDWPKDTAVLTQGVGSGAIVADTGYILTNAHVVEGTTGITVSLADGKRYPARLVSSDPTNDLAIVKIDPPLPLPFIEMGTSSDLMPGETVVALGNPFGYGHTVTVGVVSAVKRDLVIDGRTVYQDLVQTDAAINPGSSGGPLVNVHGQLIGINTAIRAQAENIGFSIPVDRVRQALVELLDYRTLNHTWLGVEFAETRHDGPPVRYAVHVRSVDPKGPAAAGLKPQDQVEALDGRPVMSLIDLKARILEKKVGEAVAFSIRRGGDRRTAAVKLAEAPRKPARELARDRLGLALQDLTPELAEQLKLAVKEGLLVSDVIRGGPAETAGLQRGDVIFQIGRYRLTRVEELGPILDRLPKGQTVRIGIVRNRFLMYFRVTVP